MKKVGRNPQQGSAANLFMRALFLFERNAMRQKLLSLGLVLLLAACGTTHPSKTAHKKTSKPQKIQLSNITVSEKNKEIMIYSMSLIGLDYTYGGNNPDMGFDCSGMVNYIYQNALGMTLPRTAAQMAAAGKPISDGQLQPGDLVFFNTTGKSYSHMGIYIGNRQFIHAPRTNSVIRAESMDNSYFLPRYQGARTFLN
jgi:cell wall-associated NlpC family hydrolase